MQRLFLLDGMALAYRAHFALIRSPIYTSKGVNSSALYGFTNTILTILESEKPTHLAVAFDTRAPTPRHQIYPAYKANREEMPEDLAAALPSIKRLCKAFRIPILELDGYEADDIIGTLTSQAEKEGCFETFMVTPDKDFGQLVSEHCVMWKPGRKGKEREIIDLPALKELWQIENPDQVIDILGLMGDASDNIPGVPGVGEKTAKKLIAEWGSVDRILENTDSLKGKLQERIIENADQARLSRKLATIIKDVPIEHSIEDLALQGRDDEEVQSLFTEFEFNSLGKRLFGKEFVTGRGHSSVTVGEKGGPTLTANLKTIEDLDPEYTLVSTESERRELAANLAQQKTFCFDIETTSLDRFSAIILGIAFSWEEGSAFYATLPDKEALEIFRPVLTGSAEKIGHNLKYDLAVLLNHGVEVNGPLFDTLIAHTLLHPDQRHSMDYLAESLLGYSPIKLSDLTGNDTSASGKGSRQTDLFAEKDIMDVASIPVQKMARYAAEDADVTLQLANLLRPDLEEKGQHRVFYEIEAKVLPVLVAMEDEGIALDLDVLASCGETMQKRIDILSASLVEQAGRDFNLNSPKQLGEILFGEMKLVEKPRKTATGQYRTDEQTLTALAVNHPFVADILSYRQASKLKSTYVDRLPEWVAEKDSRVHTQFHQLVAATGRLASSDPNLQNIPIRSDLGREIRTAFVPRKGHFVLFAADYSQVELRIMAAMSGDPGMIEAFEQEVDIHSATAARVNGVNLEEVEPAMRSAAKMVNFGIIYGISAFGLGQRLGIPRADAGEIINTYFEQYPGVKNYMDATVEEAKSSGFVETLTGRRRYLRDINSANATVRGNAERAAINTPIQGSAADMIKIAMIRVQDILESGEYRSRMLLQVHDELVFDLHEEEMDILTPKITEAMQNALPLPHGVPVRVDTGTGKNWLEAH
ncbi:MAG: DNA polymerase I [Roseibacillus sp.]|nr:DNA polymerase I [Roseibacillus sp.]|tara:strand:+ start:6698 stop:9487 length:2790 start_codon:yes stop_codon:yes gene_type:complete